MIWGRKHRRDWTRTETLGYCTIRQYEDGSVMGGAKPYQPKDGLSCAEQRSLGKVAQRPSRVDFA